MSIDSEAVVSDAELITAVRSGDVTSFADLYERHEAAALAVARQYSNSQQDAEDATSEAFSRVLATIQGGGGPDVAFRAYLFTVVRRVALARAESARRVAPTADDAAFDAIVEPAESTEAPTMAGLERGLVARAYRSLPERWQAVLWYTEVEGLTPSQVAPALGLTANGVAALSYRAREGLRQAYLQQHLAEPRSEACTIVNSKLGAYVRGGLAKRETALVESHLEECGACRAVVLELGDVNHGMQAVIGPLVLGAALAAIAGIGLGGSAAGLTAAAAAGGAGSTAGSGAAGSGTAGSGTATAGTAASGSAVSVGSTASAGTVAASGVAAIGAGSAVATTSAMTVAATGGLAGLVAALPIGLVAAAAVGVVGLSALAVGGALGLFSPDEPTAVVRAEDESGPLADPGPGQDGPLAREPSPSPVPSPEPVPTLDPADVPTDLDPTGEPGPDPTFDPAPDPTGDPGDPTPGPTDDPTGDPTDDPTDDPTGDPAPDPTDEPTDQPTDQPTDEPSDDPTEDPTDEPSDEPTDDPTDDPTDPPLPPGVLLGGFDPQGLAFAAGTPTRIDLQLTNPGGIASDEVLVELVVGDGVTATVVPVTAGEEPPPGVGAQSAPWTCEGLVCSLPSLAPSETRTLSLDVTLDAPGVDGTADVEVGMRAWLPATGAAPTPQTNPVPFTSAPAVLQVVADEAQDFAFDTPGTLTYTVANTGGTTARGVTATFQLPDGVRWLAPEGATPDPAGWACEASDATVTCALAALGPKGSPTGSAGLALDVEVRTLAGQVGVEVAADGVPGTAATTRVRELRAELGLVAHRSGVLVGTYKVTVSNAAGATAPTSELTVKVVLPRNVWLLGVSDGWTGESSDDGVLLRHGPVSPGHPKDLILTVLDLSFGTSTEASVSAWAANARPVGPIEAPLAV